MRETTDNEQVDTSDPEEREILQAADKNYWSTLPDIQIGYSFLDHLDEENGNQGRLTPNSPSTVVFRTPRRTQDDVDRPRKRLKVDTTPLSSTGLGREPEVVSPLPFSSQITVQNHSMLSYSSTRHRTESIHPYSSSMPTDSQDPLDLLHPDSYPNTPIKPGGPLADGVGSAPTLFSPDPTLLRKRQRSPFTSPTVTTPCLQTLRIQSINGTSSSPLSSVASPSAHKQQPDGDNAILRPSMEETDTNAGRWSFRSRNVHQLHPYLYERLQYKRQMRGVPDAVVNVRSPEHRRRSSPRAEQDHDFIVYDKDTPDNGDMAQEVPEIRSSKHRRKHPSCERDTAGTKRILAAGGGRGVGDPRHSSPPGRQTSKVSSVCPSDEDNSTRPNPGSSREKWYPEFLRDLSSSDRSDDDGSARLSPFHGNAPPRTSSSREPDSGSVGNLPDFAVILSPPRRRRRRRFPKPPPWERHTIAHNNLSDEAPSSVPVSDSNHVVESNNQILPVSSDERSEIAASTGPPYDRSPSSSGEYSDSESDHGLSLKDRQRLRALRRMMPAGMIQKQLQTAHKPVRRSAVAAQADSSPPTSQVLPGQSKTRVVKDINLREQPLMVGDSVSSDTGGSIIEISSSSECSISDVEEIRTEMYPGALDIPLFSASEDEETDAELETVDDMHIGVWLQRQPSRSRTSGPDSMEAREGDLIDRMLSRTRVSGIRRRNTMTTGANSRRGHVGRQPKKQSGVHVYVGNSRPRRKARQLRLPELFAKSSLRNRKVGMHRDEHNPKRTEVNANLETSKVRDKIGHRKAQARPVFVFPTGGHVVSGRRHKEGITVDVEDTSTIFHPDLSPPALGSELPPSPDFPRSIVETNDYRATHPTEFCLIPSGVSFSDDTYIGKGWLKELVTVVHDRSTPVPIPYSADGIELTPSMNIDQFSRALQSVFDHLLEDITIANGCINDGYNKWQDTLHAICQFVTWMSAGDYELVVPLRSLAKGQAERLVQHLEGRLKSSISDVDMSFIFSFYWCALELSMRSCRSSQEGMAILLELATSLVKHLLQRGFSKPACFIFREEGVIADLTPYQRISQVWISIFHITDGLHHWFSDDAPGPSPQFHGIWQLIQKAFEGEQLSDLDASEQLWSSIFNICAFSQFSILGVTAQAPRLPASWDIVSIALRRIRLSADPVVDSNIPRRRLVKRDRYIRLVISRCFFLRKRWLWSLKDAAPIFSQLVETFKSRKFANLNGESSDFPSFMRHNNVSLLSEYRNSDTAFGLFLKLAAQSIEDIRQDEGDGIDPGLPLKLRKLLSMLIPVGSVPFNKNAPPSTQELSMLYNRLSAIAVAIYLDPSSVNVCNRLNHARRYITFKEADLSTRRACIRGMMHFAMIMQHLHLPLESILEWMTDITNTLLDEYQAMGGNVDSTKEPRNRVIITLQMLLGSLRHIIESAQKLEGKSYPDPALLEGPWISRVFSTATDIANLSTTGFEIQRLVQTFLDSRAAVMPKPRRPQINNATEDSQESQDYYGQMDIDLNDPELLAALGEEPESPEVKEMQVRDKVVSEIIDKHVAPGIYRLVFKHVSEVPEESIREDSCIDIDTWIDCWVRCAQVVVHNGKRDWSFYLTLGSQSWERIIEGSWRRRVGLRFMYMFLLLDPSSYPSYKDRFIDVLLESLVSSTITMEHEYVALLFSVDRLQHPLLRDLTCEQQADGDFVMSQATFRQSRVTILGTIFRSLSESLQNEAQQPGLKGGNQRSLEHLVKLFSAMQDIYQSMGSAAPDKQRDYGSFCSRVMKELNNFGVLCNHDRLRRLFSVMKQWGTADDVQLEP